MVGGNIKYINKIEIRNKKFGLVFPFFIHYHHTLVMMRFKISLFLITYFIHFFIKRTLSFVAFIIIFSDAPILLCLFSRVYIHIYIYIYLIRIINK